MSMLGNMWSPATPIELLLHPFVAVSAILAYLFARFLYRKHAYPRFFTPLKHIPLATPVRPSKNEQEVTSSRKLLSSLKHAAATVPNNGLLRFYRDDTNERILVTGVKALNDILVTNADAFVKPEPVRRRLYAFGGDGLLLSEGETHKIQRKGLMPAFSFRHIKDLYPVFWSKSRDLVQVLEHEISEEGSNKSDVVVMKTWATRTTLDILGLAGMDHDFQFLRNPKSTLVSHYEKTQMPPSRTEILLGFVLSLFSSNYEVLMTYIPTARVRRLNEGSKYIRQLCRDLIQEKRAKMDNKPESQTEVDIISVALRSGAFTNENLVDQMMTFLAAGHGTTSHSLQWAVYALCKHQNIQSRLREEVRERLPSISDPESVITAQELDSLPYLHAFCNEVLRFYPAIPSTARKSIRDTTVAGYHIPKHTGFIIPMGIINQDSELWGPTASTFDPERWLGEGRANSAGVQNHLGFLTFLHGSRSCIGSGFARAELACLVAALVGRFQMELENPNGKFELSAHGIGTSPKDGVRTRLKVLDGW